MTMQIRAPGMNRPDPLPAARAERRAPIRELAQALKAGDLGKASDAYATLAAKAPQRATRNPDGPFARIGTALAAGDLAGARAAFAAIFTSHLPGRSGEGPAPVADRGATPGPVNSGGLLDVTA